MIENKTFPILPERYPFQCQWEITCRCNLRCVMCYTDCFNTPSKIREELTTEEIFRIMDELAEAGCVHLILTGGEPFAHPDFFKIYDDAKQKGFLVTIFTNATLITKEIADRLASNPPFRIEISLHGIQEKTFEAVTQGKGSFDKCMKAIRLLLERDLPLTLKTVAMKQNKTEVLQIREFVKSLGSVKYKLGEEMRLALDGSDIGGPFELSRQELDEIEREDPEIWKEACENRCEGEPICHSGERRFHIDAYGRLELCSGNRIQSYDLRKGSFREGFYQFLPSFPCPLKCTATPQEAIPSPLVGEG